MDNVQEVNNRHELKKILILKRFFS
jgi:hypothetical protein